MFDRMINRRIEGRYDDIWGPVVLCALLVIALIVSRKDKKKKKVEYLNSRCYSVIG
jgi:hypothetical protein